ncbi:MAG: DUF2339 domain-containing protein [Phycisphaerae bacterium]
MPDEIVPILCVGFLFFLAPLIMAIIALVRVNGLQRELGMLRSQLENLLKTGSLRGQIPNTPEWHLRQQAIQKAAQAAPPTSPAASPTATPAAEGPILLAPVGTLPVGTPAAPAPTPAPVTSVPHDTTIPLPVSPHFKPTPAPAAPPRPTEAPSGLQPPRRHVGLEENLGSRLPVIIGAIALALAGIFLVKYAFDKQILTEKVRIIMGLSFGVLLLAFAQWRRKHDPLIAQGLSGAGIADLFACFLAATNLYHLIPTGVGFAAMAATTALAVLLSLQREGGGPLIAALGLVGGFLTPLLIRTEHPTALGLFVYLAILHLGLLLVTRRRGHLLAWRMLAVISMMAVWGWVALWLITAPFVAADAQWAGLFLLVAAGGSVLTATTGGGWPTADNEKGASPSAIEGILTVLAALPSLVLGSWLLAKSGYTAQEWGFLALIVAGIMVLARLRPAYETLAWLAWFMVLMLLAVWSPPITLESPDFQNFQFTLTAFGIGGALAAYLCLWGSAAPVRWAALHSVLAFAFVLLGYQFLTRHPAEAGWAYLPLAVSGVQILLAVPVYLRRAQMAAADPALPEKATIKIAWAIDALALGIAAQWFITPPMAFEGALLTVHWAILLPVLLLACTRLRIAGLRATVLVALVCLALRVLNLPETLGYAPGAYLLWNPVVWAYGSVLLAALLAVGVWKAAAPATRTDWLWFNEALQTLGIVAGVLLVHLVVRRGFHPGPLNVGDMPLAERGLHNLVLLIGGGGMWWIATRKPSRAGDQTTPAAAFPWPWGRWSGLALLVLSLIYTVMGLALIGNPLFHNDAVGERIVLNHLLWIYGVPALLLGLLAVTLARQAKALQAEVAVGSIPERAVGQAAGIVALLMLFLLVTLEVRQGYQGSILDLDLTTTNAEMLAYSLAWAILGGLLLVAGILTGGPVLRWASLVLTALAVLKVFLWDLRSLQDLLRVLSFAGLGVALILLAWLYQHFVFRRRT